MHEAWGRRAAERLAPSSDAIRPAELAALIAAETLGSVRPLFDGAAACRTAAAGWTAVAGRAAVAGLAARAAPRLRLAATARHALVL